MHHLLTLMPDYFLHHHLLRSIVIFLHHHLLTLMPDYFLHHHLLTSIIIFLHHHLLTSIIIFSHLIINELHVIKYVVKKNKQDKMLKKSIVQTDHNPRTDDDQKLTRNNSIELVDPKKYGQSNNDVKISKNENK